MPKVSLSRVQPGMKLAKPVTNKNGVIFIKKDTELTDILIERLRDMNIEAVSIVGPSKPKIPKKEMLLAADRRFRLVENQPYMDLLKEALKEHIEGLYE
jgi:hypothetical protein